MGHKSTMEDLKEVHPAVYQNLQKLLLQDDVSHLGLVFQVSNLPGLTAFASCMFQTV